ncbi:MAG: hypothetical protein ACI4QH_02190 [Candidatus Fimimonas sp.]
MRPAASVVEKVCDRTRTINHGELVAVDTPDNVRANDKVSLESGEYYTATPKTRRFSPQNPTSQNDVFAKFENEN